MKLSDIHSAYFLGIGGIGMSALARFFHHQGVHVSGYDKTPSPLTDKLQAEGMQVVFHEDAKHVPEADLYVFTPAIPKDHPAFAHVQGKGRQWYKRSEVLQWVTDQRKTIAIAGTHGKTTTTAITAHVLSQTKDNVSAFIGGVLSAYETNVILSEDPEWVVVEADEYDRSFLRLDPEILVVTSLDADHLDIYGSYEAMVKDYQQLVDRSKQVWLNESVMGALVAPNARIYGFDDNCDLRADEVGVTEGRFTFQVDGVNYRSALPGRHNIQNALAAMAVARSLQVNATDIEQALDGFAGVKRRFERVYEHEDLVIIDDYAHHPEEIKAAIQAAKELYPEHRLAVVFQPHLFSRTRDLEDGFAEALSRADELILLPIYPARELPIEGVSSAHLLNKVPLKTKQLVEKADLQKAVLSLTAQTVLILGAGDIDRLVQPLVNAVKADVNR
jgi:UDP-N-acetylmuramate--alanine ligase